MARFFVPPSAINGKSFVLSGPESHHALHVLRKKVGDEIDLFDGQDASYRGRIETIDTHLVRGKILENLAVTSLPIQITLYQALVKSDKWEWLLEKASEIGVAKVVPVLTRRTLIKLDGAQAREKLKRWSRISLSASKQCGRTDLMTVELPSPFSAALSSLDKDQLSLIPWEKENDQSITAACKNHKGKAINIFIGPEGGWDLQEIDFAQTSGVVPVKLGPTLLRTETAGLVAATLVLREFGVY